MTNQSDSWLSIADAATALGVSENAVRVRIRRGKMLASRGNDGHIRVNVDQGRPKLSTRPESTNTTAIAATAPMVPLSALIEQQAHAEAEMARQLADRDSLHLDTLGRLQAQAAMERGLWLERIDAAELRAERVEARLDHVLDTLLQRRAWWRFWR